MSRVLTGTAAFLTRPASLRGCTGRCGRRTEERLDGALTRLGLLVDLGDDPGGLGGQLALRALLLDDQLSALADQLGDRAALELGEDGQLRADFVLQTDGDGLHSNHLLLGAGAAGDPRLDRSCGRTTPRSGVMPLPLRAHERSPASAPLPW